MSHTADMQGILDEARRVEELTGGPAARMIEEHARRLDELTGGPAARMIEDAKRHLDATQPNQLTQDIEEAARRLAQITAIPTAPQMSTIAIPEMPRMDGHLASGFYERLCKWIGDFESQ